MHGYISTLRARRYVTAIFCFVAVTLVGSEHLAAEAIPSAALRLVRPQSTTSPGSGVSRQAGKGSSAPTLQVRYFFTAEATYEEIAVADEKLEFIHFEDREHKCERWLQQSPCWTPADLTREEATLSKDEVQDLRNLIQESKFMNLESLYGGAPAQRRYYATLLRVELAGTAKEVTYQSFPDAAPPPEAFESVRKRLVELTRSKFKHDEPPGSRQVEELKTVTSPDGKVTAHWSGERPEPATPPEFGVKRLWFTFAGEEAVYEFKPKGELFLSDWDFEIFSPDGAYVLLLQDRFGPFHVVQASRLKRYLRGEARPRRIVRASDYAPPATHPAKVHHFASWVSNRAFEFEASCCGTEMRYRYDIRSGKPRLLAEQPIR